MLDLHSLPVAYSLATAPPAAPTAAITTASSSKSSSSSATPPTSVASCCFSAPSSSSSAAAPAYQHHSQQQLQLLPRRASPAAADNSLHHQHLEVAERMYVPEPTHQTPSIASKSATISVDELQERLLASRRRCCCSELDPPTPAEDLFLLDFRRACDFQRASITGSVNVCLPSLLYKRLQKGRLNLASLISETDVRERFVHRYAHSLLVLLGYSSSAASSRDRETTQCPRQGTAQCSLGSLSSTSRTPLIGNELNNNADEQDDCLFLVSKQLAEQNCNVAILEGGFEEFRSRHENLCSSSSSSASASSKPVDTPSLNSGNSTDLSTYLSYSNSSSSSLSSDCCISSCSSSHHQLSSGVLPSSKSSSLLNLQQLKLCSASQPDANNAKISLHQTSLNLNGHGSRTPTTKTRTSCEEVVVPSSTLTLTSGEGSSVSSSDLSLSSTSSPNDTDPRTSLTATEQSCSAVANMVRPPFSNRLTVDCCVPKCGVACDDNNAAKQQLLSSACVVGGNNGCKRPTEIKPLLQQNRFPVEIIPYLFLGNEQNSSNLEVLNCFEIRYILNVTPDLPNAFKDLQSSGFKYLQIPITDHWSQNLADHFPKAIEFIDEGRRNHVGVLVHCLAGISRSVTVMVAYLMQHLSLSLDEAYDIVKAQKPNVSPNFNFMGQLLEWEGKLQTGSRSPDHDGGSIPSPHPDHTQLAPLPTDFESLPFITTPLTPDPAGKKLVVD